MRRVRAGIGTAASPQRGGIVVPFRSLATLVVAVLAFGCASTSENPEGADLSYTVQVINNVPQGQPIDVHLLAPSGRTRLIGHVQANASATFRFEEIPEGSYRFVARNISGSELRSPSFDLTGARVLEWNMLGNVVNLIERR